MHLFLLIQGAKLHFFSEPTKYLHFLFLYLCRTYHIIYQTELHANGTFFNALLLNILKKHGDMK